MLTAILSQIIFVPSSFFVFNIFEGLIWFLLPAALVVVNDIAAYLAGTDNVNIGKDVPEVLSLITIMVLQGSFSGGLR